jgi:hypothetical protein
LFENGGLWRSWDHHSDFAGPSKIRTLEGINRAYRLAAAFLANATTVLVTLGTADVHHLRTDGRVVANNHKMPADGFDTFRMTPEAVAETLHSAFDRLPGRRFVLTVSPVRHLRLGLHGNQLSKAALLLGADLLARQRTDTTYFPAYELLLDDLRDYRFYTDDLLHPTPLAVDYIWQHFARTFFDVPTAQLVGELEKLHRAVRHRPFHPYTPEHQAFRAAQRERVEALAARYPTLNFSAERAHFAQ